MYAKMAVEANNVTSSIERKTRSIGRSRRLIKTRSGATNTAIWVEELAAMESERLRWFSRAKEIAANCSATLPRIGITIRPMNSCDRPIERDTGSTAETSNSLAAVVAATAAARIEIDFPLLQDFPGGRGTGLVAWARAAEE